MYGGFYGIGFGMPYMGGIMGGSPYNFGYGNNYQASSQPAFNMGNRFGGYGAGMFGGRQLTPQFQQQILEAQQRAQQMAQARQNSLVLKTRPMSQPAPAPEPEPQPTPQPVPQRVQQQQPQEAPPPNPTPAPQYKPKPKRFGFGRGRSSARTQALVAKDRELQERQKVQQQAVMQAEKARQQQEQAKIQAERARAQALQSHPANYGAMGAFRGFGGYGMF